MDKTELEIEFEKAMIEGKEKLKVAMQEASDALNKVLDISEEYGIPFYSHISHISQKYKPESFNQKWKKVNADLVEEFTDIYNAHRLYDGWQYSAVC